jgi:hypothetical protein
MFEGYKSERGNKETKACCVACTGKQVTAVWRNRCVPLPLKCRRSHIWTTFSFSQGLQNEQCWKCVTVNWRSDHAHLLLVLLGGKECDFRCRREVWGWHDGEFHLLASDMCFHVVWETATTNVTASVGSILNINNYLPDYTVSYAHDHKNRLLEKVPLSNEP